MGLRSEDDPVRKMEPKYLTGKGIFLLGVEMGEASVFWRFIRFISYGRETREKCETPCVLIDRRNLLLYLVYLFLDVRLNLFVYFGRIIV